MDILTFFKLKKKKNGICDARGNMFIDVYASRSSNASKSENMAILRP